MNTFFIIKQLFIHSQIDEETLSGDSLFSMFLLYFFSRKRGSLLTFLAIVFGSTVFTRTPGIRQYQPEVFWLWKEILGIGTCGRLGSTTGDGLLQENLLNILLLFPAGILLPGLTGRKLKWWMGLLVGIAVSSAIEISQLLLCRGLFEFDDIIHNSLGCMLGCLLGNRMLRLVYGK